MRCLLALFALLIGGLPASGLTNSAGKYPDGVLQSHRTATQATAPTSATLTSAYQPGQGFSLSCAVAGKSLPGILAPSGTVTFTDLTEGQTLETAPLAAPVLSVGSSPMITSYSAINLVAGDFNGDGKDDLAVIDKSSPPTVQLLISNGDGTFQNPVLIYTGSYPVDLVTGDFNKDGNLDLAVVDKVSGTLIVLLGDGNNGFSSTSYNITGDVPATIVAADFNQDGNVDLLVTGSTGSIFVFLGKGDGTFSALSATKASWSKPAVADFNQDGKPDLAFFDGTMLLGKGDGTFKAGQGFSLPAVTVPGDYYVPFGVVAGDFNGDGKPDLAVSVGLVFVDFGVQAWLGGGIVVLAGNGDGTFQTAPQYTSGGEPYAQVIDGDFSGSGRLDLVTSDPTGITFYVGNGDGTFGVARSTGLVGAALTAGEFAGNGTYGIAVLGSNSLAVWPQWLLEGTSSGSVTNVLFTSLVDQPHQVQCSYAGDTDYAQSDSSPVSLSYQPAAVPVFAPVPGTYPGKISVTAFPQSTGTTIYYTTDGSTPTTSSTLYTSAITVSSSVTIKAIASGSGYADSNVAVAVYSIQAPSPLVPQPVITPVSGAYFSSQTVAITDSQSGATIHYTTDGSAATANSPVYQGSFTVSTNTTVKAIAVAAGYQNSPPAWSVYTFGPIGSEAQLKITGSNPYPDELQR